MPDFSKVHHTTAAGEDGVTRIGRVTPFIEVVTKDKGSILLAEGRFWTRGRPPEEITDPPEEVRKIAEELPHEQKIAYGFVSEDDPIDNKSLEEFLSEIDPEDETAFGEDNYPRVAYVKNRWGNATKAQIKKAWRAIQ